VLLAKGIYLSSRGCFFEADKALSAAMPRIGRGDGVLINKRVIGDMRTEG
jgi:hypothetical protein